MASNRGLCGGYNSGVVRQTVERPPRGGRGRAARSGSSSRAASSRARSSSRACPWRSSFTHFEDKPTFAQVNEVVGPAGRRVRARARSTRCSIAYTKFESSSRQRPVVERVLPFSGRGPGAVGDEAKAGRDRDWIFDPDAATILTDLIPRTVRLRVFQAFLDAAVSEQVARMTAMKSATDNAQDMIKALGRLFNRSRQSQITTELTEIMGGAAALE